MRLVNIVVNNFHQAGQHCGQQLSPCWSTLWSRTFIRLVNIVVDNFHQAGQHCGQQLSPCWSTLWSATFIRLVNIVVNNFHQAAYVSKHYCVSHGVAITTFASALTNKYNKHNVFLEQIKESNFGRFLDL